MMPMTPGNQTAERRRNVLTSLLLVIVTLALYWPATTHDFILLDDALYVTGNPHVTNGLSLAALKWAFISAYASNWHPLTWLSHALDCSIYGLFAGGHHLTNILFHAVNTLLLFFALKRMTQSFWPSFVVAALFGWHPLHVESVAWVAERKDVLSTFFMLLTLLAYERHANKLKVRGSRFKVWYRLALFCFALGLMSKPMLVTLPFVLLLLDYWPLKRSAECGARSAELSNQTRKSWRHLIVEKIPFFALAFAACVATMMAQSSGGAVRTAADVPYGLRIVNALTAYAHYAGKAVWPAHLSIYYLLPAEIPVAPGICAALAMAGITALAFRWRSRCPWFIIGWLWFLGTLVPVIGLVQVGSQSMADRYTYIPLVGLFIAVAWSIDNSLGAARAERIFGGGIAAVSLLACLALTCTQLRYWHDNVSLFQHAVEVTPDNYFAEYELGVGLADAGRNEEAIVHHTTALRLNPYYEPARYHIGLELAAVGKLDDALAQFSEALKLNPRSPELHNNLGTILAQQNKLDNAIAQFQEAVGLNPNYGRAYLNCALAWQRLGQAGPALTNFARARELEPGSPQVMGRFAFFLATCPDPKLNDPITAVELAETANEITQHQDPYWLATLAIADAAAGNYSNAVAAAEHAKTKAAEQQLPAWEKKIETDLTAYRLGRGPPVDWRQPQP